MIHFVTTAINFTNSTRLFILPRVSIKGKEELTSEHTIENPCKFESMYMGRYEYVKINRAPIQKPGQHTVDVIYQQHIDATWLPLSISHCVARTINAVLYVKNKTKKN